MQDLDRRCPLWEKQTFALRKPCPLCSESGHLQCNSPMPLWVISGHFVEILQIEKTTANGADIS
jgi:hypothetical protein